ncbi:hypothetical protein [Phytohabitans suffuscus]|uniref:Uncharacterized protein n=1 Tax=Phytohabitans suffuscus TaxID=624315 RepID=A0A6F8YQ97_9ACTN|nr:hypothetical protein [Phytohabitans suffuscus]BCB88310.1 hypothetical protein Psuf_056230 [Phytohabitans suffuscus]
MSTPPAGPQPSVDELTAGIQRVLAGTYRGRDPAGLALATVDGEGLVVDVRLAPTVARYGTRAVEDAIRQAVTAAQRSIVDAFEALTAGPRPEPPSMLDNVPPAGEEPS